MTDYDEAVSELPDKLHSDSQTSGRFIVSAVRVLKVGTLSFDTYDSNGKTIPSKMEEVLTLLQSIRGYSLVACVHDNFISEKQLVSPETMFSVRFSRLNLTRSMDLYYGAWAVLDPTRSMVNVFECTDGEPQGESPLIIRPDEGVLYGDNDALKKAGRAKIFMNRDRCLYGPANHSMTVNFADDGWKDEEVQVNELSSKGPTGLSALKYIQPTDVVPGYSTVSDADVIVLRYARVLLMIVEAENEAHGATVTTLSAINKVGIRSGQPAIGAGVSQDNFRERIRNEWCIETCFEGLRYFQLKRWKLVDRLVNRAEDPAYPGYVKVYKPASEFFPIPRSEINKVGGVLEQDSAYE